MNEEQLLTRASSAWANGQRSDALCMLKEGIRLDPSSGSVRRALAERYREMGNPDQAGRWGIPLQGWTTDLERDRLARLLAASGIDSSQVVRFLALPDNRIPDSVTQLLTGPTAVYRDRFEESIRNEHEDGRSVLDVLTVTLWIVYAIANLGGAYLLVAFAVFGSVTSFFARTIAVVVCGVLALALVSSAALAASKKAKGWAIGCALGSLVVSVVAVVGLTSGWTLR